MVVHAAFGGSTNLLLHIPAIAHAAGLPRPTVEDWIAVNRRVPRLVSVLPNGPVHHPTVRVFLAGGVPEVMLHLRDWACSTPTCSPSPEKPWARISTGGKLPNGGSVSANCCAQQDGVDADDVIMSPEQAQAARPDEHGDFPARQSRAGRLGRESHGD